MDLAAISDHLGPEVSAALVGALATWIAAAAGFSAVIIQIRAQGRQSRVVVEETERRKIKAAMYEDAVLVCRSMVDAATTLSNSLIIMDIDLSWLARAGGKSIHNIPSARFPVISQYYQDFSDAAFRLIFLIESRLIIDPRLAVFRTALNSVLHDTSRAMHSDFVNVLIPALPVDNPEGGIFPYTPPTVEHVEKLHTVTEKFVSDLADATAYAEDLQVDLQNLLLGDLFDNRLKPRQPRDPTKRVVTVLDADSLERWFTESTAWGKMIAQADEAARARFATEVSSR